MDKEGWKDLLEKRKGGKGTLKEEKSEGKDVLLEEKRGKKKMLERKESGGKEERANWRRKEESKD